MLNVVRICIEPRSIMKQLHKGYRRLAKFIYKTMLGCIKVKSLCELG